MQIKHALFVTFLILSLSAQGNGQYNNWMAQLMETLYDKSLLDVVLPGSHDSTTYHLQNELAPGSVPNFYLAEAINWATEFGIPLDEFIAMWSQSQNLTVYEQLNGGIRYIDFRVCLFQNITWNSYHFLITVPVESVLNDIARFMLENPYEVIVLELGGFDGATPDQQYEIGHLLNSTLNEYLLPVQPDGLYGITIGEMVKMNKRIITTCQPYIQMCSEPRGFDFLWDWKIYREGVYADTDDLDEMVVFNTKQMETFGGHGKLTSTFWTLTTSINEFVELVIHPHADEIRSLKDLAMEADKVFLTFVDEHKNFQIGNLLIVDWYQYTSAVTYAIAQNERMCNDQIEYRARSTTGQDCRSWFFNGNCTKPELAQFMKINCPLSCGFC